MFGCLNDSYVQKVMEIVQCDFKVMPCKSSLQAEVSDNITERPSWLQNPLRLPGGEFSRWNLKRVVDKDGGGVSENTRVWTASDTLYFQAQNKAVENKF